MQWIISSVGRSLVWLLIVCGTAEISYAQQSTTQQPTPQQVEIKAAWQAAEAVMQRGPQEITLRDEAKLQLPDGYAFVPSKEATRAMVAMGNQADDQLIGLIVPVSDAQWIMTVKFHSEGYIKDDDAKDWKADEMLSNMKEATEEGNKRRADMGIPAIEVTRWVEVPKYDASVHHLVWSAEVRRKNGNDPDPSINYNTYVLGRDGFISMDLITATSTIDADKQSGNELLAGVTFNSGKRYSDFNSSTDKIAAYGLAALVGGLVVKKLGLLALLGVFLVKFKALLIGAMALIGGWFKRFRQKKDEGATLVTTAQLPAPVVEKSPADAETPPRD